MFESKGGLTGKRIASFRMPQAAWKKNARVFSIACFIAWAFIRIKYSWKFDALFFLSLVVNMVTATRYVRFYEKGLSLPKHAGAVFLTRDQVLGMKLEGDTFTVTGPDASWDGPYSGGKFQIRGEDLTGFRDALTQFTQPVNNIA